MGSLPTLVIVSELNQIVGHPAVSVPRVSEMWVLVWKNYTAGIGSVLWMQLWGGCGSADLWAWLCVRPASHSSGPKKQVAGGGEGQADGPPRPSRQHPL